MPDYSVAVEDGHSPVYMTEVSAADAREVMRRLADRVEPGAQTARIEIVEVLEDSRG